MAELSLLFIWLYYLDMIRVIYGRYKNDWITTRNQQLKPRLGDWKKVIKILLSKQGVTDTSGSSSPQDTDLKKKSWWGGKGKTKDTEDSTCKQTIANLSVETLQEDLKMINELEKEGEDAWEMNDPDAMDQLEHL